MDDDLYRTLAAHAKTHAASKGLSDDYAMGFLNAMWYSIDAAVRDRQTQTTPPLVTPIHYCRSCLNGRHGTCTDICAWDGDEPCENGCECRSWSHEPAPEFATRGEPTITYKPGWSFRWERANDLLFLNITAAAPDAKGFDAYTGEPRRPVTWKIAWYGNPFDPRSLRSLIAELEAHERDEWLLIEGRRVFDPHRPDSSPNAASDGGKAVES